MCHHSLPSNGDERLETRGGCWENLQPQMSSLRSMIVTIVDPLLVCVTSNPHFLMFTIFVTRSFSEICKILSYLSYLLISLQSNFHVFFHAEVLVPNTMDDGTRVLAGYFSK